MEAAVENEKLDLDKLIHLFKETRIMLKEQSLETDRKFQETRAILDERSRETERQFKATDKEIKDLIKYSKQQDIKVKELNKLFVNQWGQLVESLVEGKIVEMFNQRGINVQQTFTNLKTSRNEAEFDIIAENGKEVVVIEVKTTLRKEYTDEFMEKLKNFKTYFPKYSNNIIYGAMAYLKSPVNISKYTTKLGLFLIKGTGDSAFITNPEDFKPKSW